MASRQQAKKQITGLASAVKAIAKKGEKIIPDEMTFREWCIGLGQNGLKVDGLPFELDTRPAMHFIYDLIPTTPKEAFKKTVVLMKSAQVGFTVAEMLAAIYLALKFEPCKVGMYLPDMKLAAAKSSERFLPVMRTVPEAYALLRADDEASGKKGSEGNVMIRTMGASRFHFLWTSGRATTESFPMDVLSFDEVQEMSIDDMEKTQERLSASKIKFTLMGSTANWPDSDIHYWFKKGTQHQFHTRCPHCDELNVLDEYFPECIKYNEGQIPGAPVHEYVYVCQHCGGWLEDTQYGEWIAKEANARITSVHFPQFLSPTISAREIIEAFHSASSMKNFYNRKLGKPYLDPSQVPVNLEMLNECAADGMKAGVIWKKTARHTFMGIDQMGAFNVAIIKERLPDGRQAVIHIEEIRSDDPFARCDELMEIYGVQVCAVETLPNYNDAKRFAFRHLGKVFLAGYGNMEEDMLAWGDAKLTNSERKTDEEERDRYTVRLDQYKCMQTSMARFARRTCVFPDPMGLTQEVVIKGKKESVALLKDVVFFHFTRTALVAEKDEEEKKYKRKVVKVGIDPHFSYANMLCDVAWARAHGTSTFLLPESAEEKPHIQEVISQAMPGLNPAVVAMIDNQPAGERCGKCFWYQPERSRCEERGLLVRRDDAGCILFIKHM